MRGSRSRWVLMVVAGVLATSALAGCGSGATPSGTSDGLTTIRYTHTLNTLGALPFYVATGKGYFAAHGVAIDRQPDLPGALQLGQLVAANQTDVAGGIAPNGPIAVIASGKPIVGLAYSGTFTQNQLVLTNAAVGKIEATGVRADSPVPDRIKALRGLTLATLPEGTNISLMTNQALRRAGLDPATDVTLQPLPDYKSFVAFARAGKIDGFIASPPDSTLLVSEGRATVWVQMSDVFPGVVPLAYFASPEFAKAHPEALVGFLAALDDAQELIRTDLPAAIEAARVVFPDLDQTLYEAAVKASVPAFTGSNVPTKEGYDATLEYVNAGLAAKIDLPFEKVFDPSYAEKAESGA